MAAFLLALSGLALIAQLYWLASALTAWTRRRSQIFARRPRPFRVTGRTDHDADVFSFTLEPVRHRLSHFKGGQYLTVVGPPMKSGVPAERRYSLDRWDARPKNFGLTIKREEQGSVSRWLHETAQLDATLYCRPPSGDFTLPNAPEQRRIVLVAAGVGITPMRAMLHEISASEFARCEVGLFYSARTSAGLPFHDEFEKIAASQDAFHYHPALTADEAGWSGARGRISADTLFAFGGLRAHYLFCASATMIDALMDGLRSLGVPDHQLHHELFGGSAGICGKHVLTVDDIVVEVEGYPSLLAAMEAHAVPVIADCRAGHCGLCRRRVLSGDVIHGPALACDLKEGECLPCVAIPLTDLELAA